MIGKKSNFVSTFFYCIKLSFQASKFYAIFRILYSAAWALITLAVTYVGKMIIDELVGMNKDSDMRRLIFLLAVVSILTIAMDAAGKINDYIVSMHNELLTTTVNMKLMNISSTADMEFFDSPEYYDAFEMVKNDTYAVLGVVWSVMLFISYAISLGSALLVVSGVNISFGIIVIAATVPTGIISKKYAKELYFWDIEHIDEQRKLNYINDVVSDKSYASDIRLYNLGSRLVKYYHEIWSGYFQKRRAINKKRVTWNVLIASIPWISVFFMLLWIAYRIKNGNATVGDYSLYSGMLQTLSTSTFLLIDCGIEIYENKLKMDNIRNFNKYESKIADTGKEKISSQLTLEFKNVTFRYPGTENNVLENVSFKIHNGERVGIVGLNGSGKSTLIKLILRFYDPTSGEILINDKNIKEYPLQELRNHFSTFFQQYVIFAFSMKNNITMFQPEVREENILKALEYSDADDVLELVGNDMDTYLTKGFEENGVELSGGQKQKMALARAFYRNAGCVILDEPSAALDPEAEYKIFERMKELCKGKTAIFVSHRLSNIVFADKVILMEKGKVIEKGTHKELINLNGRYAELFDYQARQYNELSGEK